MLDSKEFKFKLAGDSPLGRAGAIVQFDRGNLWVNGKRIDLALTPTDVHLPEELSTYLSGYKQPGFRADEMSPVIHTDQEEDYFRDFGLENTTRRVDVKGSREGNIPEVDPSSSLTKFKMVDRVLGSFVPQRTEEAAAKSRSLYKPRWAAMKKIGSALLLDREFDVLAMLTTSANWAAGQVVTLGATFQWNGGAASDPVRDLQARIMASAQPVSAIWMSQESAFDFLSNTKTKDYMKQIYGDGPTNLASPADAAAEIVDFKIVGLPIIRVHNAKVWNDATGITDPMLSDDVVLVTVPRGTPTDGESASTTYTFRLNGPDDVGFETREFRIEGRGAKGGTMLVAFGSDIAVMTGKNCGGLIKNVKQ